MQVHVSAEHAGVVLAEAHAAGAAGAEERDAEQGVILCLYAAQPDAARVRQAVAGLGALVRIGPLVDVAAEDWGTTWRRGFEAVSLGEQLVVRPPFAAPHPSEARGAALLEIDPGQAFGTGAHASTRLVLRQLAGAAPLAAATRVLDVGTGSGVLALAALRFGAEQALGIDLDPVAIAAARENARANGLASRLGLCVGSLDALAIRGTWDWLLANLLRRELEPLLPGLAARLAPSGRLLVAGLLDRDADVLAPAFAAAGLQECGRIAERDADDACWVGLVMARRPHASDRSAPG